MTDYYYKLKYIKYKMKYLNLLGGDRTSDINNALKLFEEGRLLEYDTIPIRNEEHLLFPTKYSERIYGIYKKRKTEYNEEVERLVGNETPPATVRPNETMRLKKGDLEELKRKFDFTKPNDSSLEFLKDISLSSQLVHPPLPPQSPTITPFESNESSIQMGKIQNLTNHKSFTNPTPNTCYDRTPIPQEKLRPKDLTNESHEREHLGLLMEMDDTLADELNDDEEYVNYEGEIGKSLELWFGKNMNCPICGQRTLRAYESNSFPIIDLKCTNDNHTYDMGVKYFQVKTSSGNNFLRDKKYFSKDHVYVGKSKYAEPVHSIKSSDTPELKKALVGYICLFYDRNERDNTIIIKNTSFYLLPNINAAEDKQYYDFSIDPTINKAIIKPTNICSKLDIPQREIQMHEL